MRRLHFRSTKSVSERPQIGHYQEVVMRDRAGVERARDTQSTQMQFHRREQGLLNPRR